MGKCAAEDPAPDLELSMRFKVTGVLLLLAGMYFAIAAYLHNFTQPPPAPAVSAQVDGMLAIFIALLVRVFQAQKHHRDIMRLLKKSQEEESALPEGVRIAAASIVA
jgi:hypothetical protein